MARFTVQVLERRVYFIEIEADDPEEAADQAMEQFDDLSADDGQFESAVAELVINKDTGEQTFRG